jgi:2'-5' RNA ligase
VRLFVAIDLDAAAREAVAAEQRRLAKAIRDADGEELRWVPPERLHLTLVFLGEVADRQLPALTAVFDDEIVFAPFVARLTGLGVFPSRGAPKALWVGVGEGAPEVTELQRRAAELATRAGSRLEERVFRPHLTLARWRASRPADARRALAADPHREIAGPLPPARPTRRWRVLP